MSRSACGEKQERSRGVSVSEFDSRTAVLCAAETKGGSRTIFSRPLFYCFFLQASILQNFFLSPFKEFFSDNHKYNENNNNIDNLCSYHCCLGKSDDLSFEKDFSLNFLKIPIPSISFFKEYNFKLFFEPKNNSPPKI